MRPVSGSFSHIGDILEGLTRTPGRPGQPYEPPYGSPLEERLAWSLAKHLRPGVELRKQVEVPTICGRFILDFVAYQGSAKFAFECDGKRFHNPHRDEWRDAMILGAGAADVIYRLRGGDLTYHPEDCLYLVSLYSPELFTPRALAQLKALSSPEARSYHPQPDETMIDVTYPSREGPNSLRVERRLLDVRPGLHEHWQSLFSYADAHNGGDLDELMASFQNEL